MEQGKRKQERTLEVESVFEPSRLARDHLAEAYRQVAPSLARGRSTGRSAPPGALPDQPVTPGVLRRARP